MEIKDMKVGDSGWVVYWALKGGCLHGCHEVYPDAGGTATLQVTRIKWRGDKCFKINEYPWYVKLAEPVAKPPKVKPMSNLLEQLLELEWTRATPSWRSSYWCCESCGAISDYDNGIHNPGCALDALILLERAKVEPKVSTEVKRTLSRAQISHAVKYYHAHKEAIDDWVIHPEPPCESVVRHPSRWSYNNWMWFLKDSDIP